MQLWDGLSTKSNCTVVVMGATNRPKDVDRAILRRMPSTFHVGLPDMTQRKAILRQILLIETVADDIDYNRLAQLSEHFSGSDIRELCRTASVYRVRDLKESDSLRPIDMDDLLKVWFSFSVELKLTAGVALHIQQNDYFDRLFREM